MTKELFCNENLNSKFLVEVEKKRVVLNKILQLCNMYQVLSFYFSVRISDLVLVESIPVKTEGFV